MSSEPTESGAIAGLSAEERGFLLGAFLLGFPSERGGWGARLAAPEGTRIDEVLQALEGRSREGRVRFTSALAEEAAAPFPASLEAVDGSWLRAALRDEPSERVRALAEGAPAAVRAAAWEVLRARGVEPPEVTPEALLPEVVGELQRALFGWMAPGLPPLPAGSPAAALLAGTPPSTGSPAAPLAGMPSSDLAHALRRRGARALGVSISGAPPEIVARALAAIGPEFADGVATAAASPASEEERALARADLERTAAQPADFAEERLTQAGLRALRRELGEAGEEALLAVALRLPEPLGRALMAAGGEEETP